MPDKKQGRIEDAVKGIVIPKGKKNFPGEVGIGLSPEQRVFATSCQIGSTVILGGEGGNNLGNASVIKKKPHPGFADWE